VVSIFLFVCVMDSTEIIKSIMALRAGSHFDISVSISRHMQKQ